MSVNTAEANRVYEAGAAHRHEGHPINDNPYPEGSDLAEVWYAGYEAADEELSGDFDVMGAYMGRNE